ncbi:MAG: protein phosphatase 2C domain-containing protein [Pseudomonadota bacterium]
MPTACRISGTSAIHQGDRAHQQDQVALLSHPRLAGCILAVVADGMGGRSGGRAAADQVLMTARQLFAGYAPPQDSGATLLQNLATQAHTVIRLTAISSEQEPHSTLAAFVLNPDGQCHWVHAGDSRVYHFRNGVLVYRTRDHSYVQKLVDRGELPEAQAAEHPDSHILTCCLGAAQPLVLGTHYLPNVQPGDVLLACSDGLWHYFTDVELARVLHQLPPREASEFLTAKARSRAAGHGDNLSLAVVKIEAAPAPVGLGS